MSDEFVMSVGLAHELQFAFRRGGWTAEQVKELAKGDTLERLQKSMFRTPALDQNIFVFFEENKLHADLSWGRLTAISSILKGDCITNVRQMVQMTEYEFIHTPNLGRNGLEACKRMLSYHGLHFGMKFD